MTPPSKYDNGRQAAPVLDRIKQRCIETSTGCWLWQGTTVKGYGRTKTGSRRDGTRRAILVHVATYEAKHGPVPVGLQLDHVVCDTPACANPDHVSPVAGRANTLRSPTSPTAVNARKTACPKCGGPYTATANGRSCQPCRLAYFREYNAARR